MKADQVQPRPRHQRRQPLHEIERAHHNVRRSAAPRCLELELHLPCRVELNALVGQPPGSGTSTAENGAVQELHIERALERGLVGNVYVGKVARVLPGMQSAFIEVGLDRAAFLYVADLNPPANGAGAGSGRDAAATPIERQIFEGQPLTVQVIKDPIGSKGARLSAQVSIAGRMLVFLPHDKHIGISQKIGSAELREQLRTRMHALVGEGEHGKGGGFILRTNAEEATDAELADDIAYLRKTWGLIRERAQNSAPGTLLHQDLSLAERVLRDLANEATHAIRIDSGLHAVRQARAVRRRLHAAQRREAGPRRS